MVLRWSRHAAGRQAEPFPLVPLVLLAPPVPVGGTGKADETAATSRKGTTIPMVEHELAIMDEFSDPVAVMADGRVLPGRRPGAGAPAWRSGTLAW